MGKQEGESRWWAHSKSSTVLLDPAAFVENWKRQIQGKDGIPLQQQRLTFKVGNQEEEEGLPQRPKDSTCGVSGKGLGATDLIQDLQTWKALLRCNDVILGKLENPLVEAESEQSTPNLYCQAAQELRNIGNTTECNDRTPLKYLQSNLRRRSTLSISYSRCLFKPPTTPNFTSVFYEAAYDAASTIDYSKEPMEHSVVNSPPLKNIFRPSPSPLKGLKRSRESQRSDSPSPSGGNTTPQRRLRMGARPRDAVPAVPFPKVASKPVRTRSKDALSIESESLFALRRSARQSTSQMSSHSNFSSYNLGFRRHSKFTMIGHHPNQGYSRGPEIFRRVEDMRAQEAAAKEKEVKAKAAKGNASIGSVHK